MRVSIITTVYKGVKTIEDCIKSIINQTYSNVEYIIIDGGSTDGTLDIIKKYMNSIAKVLSEPDDGIYHAMNKGIKIATGEVVGILNSDDIYADNYVIENVVRYLSENDVDCCYGDLVYVDKNDANKIVRKWIAGNFAKRKFEKGWMPPHPAFFVKNRIYEKYGSFNLKFPIVADYELMLRLLYKHDISTIYIPKILVKMRTGGKSNPSFNNVINNSISCYHAWKANGLRPKIITFLLKPILKVSQFIK